MSYINKSTNFKLWLIVFLISWIILYLNNDANAKYMKKLVKNPSWAEDLGERLYESVKDKYDLNVVTKTRAEIYKTITK